MKKRIFSLLLAVILLAVMLPLSASATGRTVDEAIAWAKSQVGQAIDYDGAYGAQCVDLILAYYNYLGVATSSGNGKDYAWNTLPAGWTRVQGGTPQRGDILVYSGTSDNGGYGHVAIYESDYVHYDQNIVGYYGVVRCTWHYNYNGNYWGYIRPNWSISASSSAADKITLDSPWLTYRSENNAVVHSVIRNNGAAVGCDKYTFQIWEKYSGKLLKSYSEDISQLKNYDHVDVWLDIATETGLYLSPNTAYQCQFSTEKGGKTYSSSKFEFVTKYSSSEDSKKPANVKLTAPSSSTIYILVTNIELNFSVTDGISAKGARYFQLLQDGEIIESKLTSTSKTVQIADEGDYTFILRAVNDVGSTDSSPVTVHVIRSEAPHIVLDKQSFSVGEKITGKCVKGTYGGTLFGVLLDDELVASLSEGPFSLDVDLEPGQHTLGMFTGVTPHEAAELHLDEYVSTTFTVTEETSDGFGDVSTDAYYYDAVQWAVQEKITSGTNAGTFSPNKTCTRAEAVTLLYRAAGSPEPASSTCSFSDVKSSAYYYKAVLWAVEQGITSGASATKFSPDATCTRAQIVAFLHRFAGTPSVSVSNSFNDVSDGQYYYSAVQWAIAEGITAGTGSGKFSPDSSCTRAQIVTFLCRAYA